MADCRNELCVKAVLKIGCFGSGIVPPSMANCAYAASTLHFVLHNVMFVVEEGANQHGGRITELATHFHATYLEYFVLGVKLPHESSGRLFGAIFLNGFYEISSSFANTRERPEQLVLRLGESTKFELVVSGCFQPCEPRVGR